MKFTQTLLRQHIGWHFKQIWLVQSKKKVYATKAQQILEEKGIPVVNPEDIVPRKKLPTEKVEVVGLYTKPAPYDETHPKWKARMCLTYKDDNVLLEGLNQAKVITNTVEVQQGLPDKLVLHDVSKDLNNLVKKIVLTSHVFDAEQKKLPKIKDPLRPAYNFPRVYGITEQRVKKLLVSKLLHLIETNSNPDIAKERYLLNDLFFSFPFEKSEELFQFELTSDTFLSSSKPLSPINTDPTEHLELPDIFPIKPTITLNPQNFYELSNIYPFKQDVKKSHPHTIFVHFNRLEVQNIYGEEVTEPQIFGRSLLKSFTVCASYAKQKFGGNVKKLPEPVTIQCVQTDGRLFHFGIFQLNTLDLEDGKLKNVWYQTGHIPLFETCCYQSGRATLKGYDDSVIRHLFAFSNNI